MAERVHCVVDYYDGLVTGFADYEGRPHHFECQVNEQTGLYTDRYILTPVSDVLLDLAMESEHIFRSWEKAFNEGECSPDTHPGIEGQNPRFIELNDRVEIELSKITESRFSACARFEVDETRPVEHGMRNFLVDWLNPSDATNTS